MILHNALNKNIISLAIIFVFSLLVYLQVIFFDKTISSFDLCYFRDAAFKELRPAILKRPSNPLLSDPVNQFQPWDIATIRGIINFPYLWNPFNGCGSPLLANSQSSIFFPLKYITYLFGIKKGFGYFCFLKTLLAGIFMYMYLRMLKLGHYARIIGSLGFMTCGFMIVWLQYPLANAALFLPLLFMGCEFAFSEKFKKCLAALAGGTALSFLGGHPETTVHCLFGTGIYAFGLSLLRLKDFLRKKPWLQYRYHILVPIIVIILSVLLGTLIAAVQILPAGEYILNSYALHCRGAEHNPESSLFSFSIKHIVTLYKYLLFYLIPNTWGNPSIHDQWWWGHFSKYHENGYIGAGLLFMSFVSWALCSINRKIMLFVILQIISLGFIAEIPLITSTLGQMPPLNLATNSRFVLLFSFSGAVMAAFAFDYFWKGGVSGTVKIWVAIIIILFFVLSLFDFFTRFAFSQSTWMFQYGLKNILHFFIFFIPWIFLTGIQRLSARNKSLAGAFLIIVTAADLYLMQSSYNPAIKADAIYVEPLSVTNIKRHIADARVIPVTQFKPCLGIIYRLQDPRIYDAIGIAWYAKYLEYTGYVFPLHEILPDFNHRFASIASMRYIWIPIEVHSKNAVHYKKVFSDNSSALYENPDALPRAYIASSWQPVANNREAFETLNAIDFPWQKKVAIEIPKNAENILTVLKEPDKFLPAEIVSYNAHEIVIELPLGSRGLLVLNDSFYPGWEASVDGKQTPVYRVNGTFRGVFIGDTNRVVTFKYRPASFFIGLVISFVSLGIAAIVLFNKRSLLCNLLIINHR